MPLGNNAFTAGKTRGDDRQLAVCRTDFDRARPSSSNRLLKKISSEIIRAFTLPLNFFSPPCACCRHYGPRFRDHLLILLDSRILREDAEILMRDPRSRHRAVGLGWLNKVGNQAHNQLYAGILESSHCSLA
jgi:hypothetical protein